MTPKQLTKKHGISRSLVPVILQKSYRQVDGYLAESINIPDAVIAQCWLIDFYLGNGGSLSSLIDVANRSFCEEI